MSSASKRDKRWLGAFAVKSGDTVLFGGQTSSYELQTGTLPFGPRWLRCRTTRDLDYGNTSTIFSVHLFHAYIIKIISSSQRNVRFRFTRSFLSHSFCFLNHSFQCISISNIQITIWILNVNVSYVHWFGYWLINALKC